MSIKENGDEIAISWVGPKIPGCSYEVRVESDVVAETKESGITLKRDTLNACQLLEISVNALGFDEQIYGSISTHFERGT